MDVRRKAVMWSLRWIEGPTGSNDNDDYGDRDERIGELAQGKKSLTLATDERHGSVALLLSANEDGRGAIEVVSFRVDV